MRLRPLPLVVVPGLLQLVSARPAARPTPHAPGPRFGGKTAPAADSEAESGAAWDMGSGAQAVEGV